MPGMQVALSSVLRQKGLKDTAPRRRILESLASKKPFSPRALQQQIRRKGEELNIVTIYRVLEALEQAGIVHRHPVEGTFSLCSIPDVTGHHVLFHCTDCGAIQEMHDHVLCSREEALARQLKFTPSAHVSTLSGHCSSCAHD